MKYFTRLNILFKCFLLIVCTILSSDRAKAQADPNHSFLNIATEADDEEEKTVQPQAEALPDSVNAIIVSEKHICKYIFFDFGNTDLKYNNGSVIESAHGSTFAFSGQVAYKFATGKAYKRLFLSAGLELRNFNSTYTVIDSRLGIKHDYLHFLYAGVPVLFQYVNTKHTAGRNNDINCYFQLGMSIGYKVMMTESNEYGTETDKDREQNYNNLLLQPFISAGISYTTQRKVCLIG